MFAFVIVILRKRNNLNMKKLLTLLIIFTAIIGNAQNNISYWQQHVDYQMDVDFDVKNYQYKGTQKLIYTNNSPDILHQVFYHLLLFFTSNGFSFLVCFNV